MKTNLRLSALEKNPDQMSAETAISKPVMKQRIGNTKRISASKLFTIEKWTLADDQTTVRWEYKDTGFGEIFIASTDKGICFAGFTNGDRLAAFKDLQRRFPANLLVETESQWHLSGVERMNNPQTHVQLHLRGTEFQLNIWRNLMEIPFGGLTTYTSLCGDPQLARAAGTAVGANPVCFILPCHRVVRSDGSYDGYYWGNDLKRKLLIFEATAADNFAKQIIIEFAHPQNQN